jgi:hypothetical protein
MIKLQNLLLESLSIYEIEVMIKVERQSNKVDIYNEIRGIEGVVVVKVEQNTYLNTLTTDQTEYALLHMKYIVRKDPKESISEIKRKTLITYKIPGLLKFMPRFKTLEKITTL